MRISGDWHDGADRARGPVVFRHDWTTTLAQFEQPAGEVIPIRRWTALRASVLGALGLFSSAFGAFAMLCCFGWTGLATFLPVIGLGFLVRFTVALRLIWIALGLTASGLALSFRGHRRPWPLATATLGAGLLLYPMYHALEVPVWLGLLYTGLGLLFLSSVLDIGCAWHTGRVCRVAGSSGKRGDLLCPNRGR